MRPQCLRPDSLAAAVTHPPLAVVVGLERKVVQLVLQVLQLAAHGRQPVCQGAPEVVCAHRSAQVRQGERLEAVAVLQAEDALQQHLQQTVI